MEVRSFPLQLILFLKQQLKLKIRAERRRLSSLKFGESVSRLLRLRGANLEWHLEVT